MDVPATGRPLDDGSARSPTHTRLERAKALTLDESPAVPRGIAAVFSSRRRQTRLQGDWSSDVCSSDLYALSNLFRGRGAITVIGGPHARCYPEDAARYFDYVLGFTDKGTLRDVLRDCSQHRPAGVNLAASQQPRTLPGVRERWQF